MKNLADTVEAMMSDEYRERFAAEYWQTKIRYDKLHKMIVMWEAGTLTFIPVCPIELLKRQAAAMGEYLMCLEIRASAEGIDLEAE